MTAANEGAPSRPFAALAEAAREAKRLKVAASDASERGKKLAFDVRSSSNGGALCAAFNASDQGGVYVYLSGIGSREDLVKVIRKLIEFGVVSAAEVLS